MRRSLGPLVLLAILALPALVAPVVGWHPAPIEPAEVDQDVPAASFDYLGRLDADDIAAESRFGLIHEEPRAALTLQDSAVASLVTVTLADRHHLRVAVDAEPVEQADLTEQRFLIARAQIISAAIETSDDSEQNVELPQPLPFHALLVLEAQRTIVAVGLSVHTGVSSAVTRLDSVPVPSIATMQAAAFTTSSDAIPGWLLQVAWILLLVAIGLAIRPGILAVAVALFSRFNQGDILDNERRNRLFSAIQADPGATFGELCQRAQLAAGVAQHHLRLLEQHELVRRTRDGRATRFYPQGPRFDPPALRNATRQRLVDLLRQDPAIDTKQLAQQLGQRPQSTWHHLHVLKDAGVLAPIRRGRLIRWNILTR